MELAGVKVGRIEAVGTVGENTSSSSPKPSNSQPPQNKGTGKGDDFAKEPFLPDEYYINNYVPDDGTPGARFDFSRLGSRGQIENSKVIYDQAGKQKFRIDY